MTPASPHPDRRREPVDASMTLLNEVMHRPLDPGYAAAARDTRTPRRPTTTVALGALAVVLGLVTVTAVRDLRAPQPAVLAARTVLEKQIVDRQGETDRLRTAARDLSAQIDTLQTSALAQASPALLDQIQQDALAAGTVPVTGPGLVVTLTDGTTTTDDTDQASVADSDLQRVANALWAGGAEAVTINGQRLTTVSAIRSAGSAILVDLQPLVGPYRVEAIGDADAMRVALARTGTSDLLRVLGSRYGIQSSVIPQSSLNLPGAPTTVLYYATPSGTVESPRPTTTDTSTSPSSATSSRSESTGRDAGEQENAE